MNVFGVRCLDLANNVVRGVAGPALEVIRAMVDRPNAPD